ncbi:MAG: UDP-N-acetylglucosamine 4,6-dehydratase (inverting) [Deltaproteobacteria bacterium]|nr:UDP-N-acetylglucosamine 4,6-dehydratase (inverting) [Deltaproteobacteria bacterium]
MDARPPQVLVTGGTGSFGRAFVRRLLRERADCTIRIYSRDELKQYEMARAFGNDPRLRFFIGDVRDRDRLARALYGVDWLVHAAALKQVHLCEYNPAEAVKTNVLGAQNVIDAAIDAGVAKVVALSTDKAVNPVNLYGATKLCAEKLFVHGSAYSGPRETRFACVRYGNVLGSRGSVVPLFLEQAATGVLPITDLRMSRFWITLGQAVELVLQVLHDLRGGEIYVPKIPSMRMVDLARAIAPEAMLKEVGMRPGEKLHEMLLTPEEAHRTREYATHFVVSRTTPRSDGRPVSEDFAYRSDTNSQWLDVDRLRELVHELAGDER